MSILIILFLLIIRALSDLSLPSYTSDIVDIGIQQKGIPNAVPNQIRAETLENLKLFMKDEEIQIIENSYRLDDTGYYKLYLDDKEYIEKLNYILEIPILILSQLENNSTTKLEDIKIALNNGIISKEQLIDMKDSAIESMGNLNSNFIQQKAVLFIQKEYEAMGINIGDIQIKYLLITGAKMLGVTLLMALASILVGLIASRVAAKIGMELRQNVFKKVISFSKNELDKFSTASLITRTTNDVQQIQQTIVILLRMVLYAPILGIGGVIKVYNTKTGMGWIIAAAVGTILILISILIKIAMPKFKRMQEFVDNLNLVSREILTGISVVRAFSRERYEEKRFDNANRKLMKTQLFTSRVMSFMFPIMLLIMNTITIIIVWFGAKGIDLGNLQVGDMMAFITYTMQIVMSFMMLTMISIMLPRANVSANRIKEVLNTESSILNKPDAIEKEKEHWNGVLEFHNVSFHFPGAEENVLENINFIAKPGKVTAIIGGTGSGKSTLINLIPRFYDVTIGKITIDGIDIRDISQKTLHDLLGLVPQKSILFSGNIESNLKFGGNNISDEAMIEAAKIAQVSQFIEGKSQKYKSQISQGGKNVSGGQKQRLSIARAIAKNPKIFLFDDSFSALDYKTDVILRRALNKKVKDATVIIVSQRISTIMNADQIIVLDEGKIVGIGTHKQLLLNCETYKEIAKSQLSPKELGMKEGEL
ncbi:ABC transporter ATP-binding protein [Defluviitalea phaphyphila]|uniref:ABC transporter ATP-binding protein n=1 Tax=Defluviitalea phaphyphila TaxID=1473580 RepID=UPI001FA81218|nr:ABC transporter ATP-binding protein [Defluviitalea phaphyphila]